MNSTVNELNVFFHNLPRYNFSFQAVPNNFDITSSYFQSIGMFATPFAFLLICLIFVALPTCCCALFSSAPRKRASDAKTGACNALLIFCLLLSVVAAVVAFFYNHSLNDSLTETIDILNDTSTSLGEDVAALRTSLNVIKQFPFPLAPNILADADKFLHDANNTISDIKIVLAQIDEGESIRFQATTIMLAPTVVHSLTTVGLWRLAGNALYTWKLSSLLSFLIGFVQILEGAVDSPLTVMSSDLCPLAMQLNQPNPVLPDSQQMFDFCAQYSNLLAPVSSGLGQFLGTLNTTLYYAEHQPVVNQTLVGELVMEMQTVSNAMSAINDVANCTHTRLDAARLVVLLCSDDGSTVSAFVMLCLASFLVLASLLSICIAVFKHEQAQFTYSRFTDEMPDVNSRISFRDSNYGTYQSFGTSNSVFRE